MKQSYRADIDGLRAIAVMAVVVFHFFPKLLPGGFVGVDIFFVISGFLITGIINDEISAAKFSIIRFYQRRARRIFPALILVLLVSLLVGKILLLNSEFISLLDSSIAGVFFSSNIYFWKTANYFDSDALSKPLLHLWSLGVEEQFYLVWPLFVLMLPVSRSKKLFVVAAAILISFAINIHYTNQAPVAAFFLSFGRLWELALGGAGAYLVHSPRLSTGARQLASLLGLALLAFSILRLREAGFPGWQALAPSVGALLLLVAGPSAFFSRQILATPIPVQLGRISYPIYLWHWPVISFCSISFGEVSRAEKIYGLLASILLGFLTYHCLEKPLKRMRPVGRAVPVALAAGLASVAVVCLGLRLVIATDDTPQERFVAKYRNYPTDHKIYDAYHFYCGSFDDLDEKNTNVSHPGCTDTTAGYQHLLIWGDSHAQHLRYGLDKLVAGTKTDLMQVTTAGCGPTLDIDTGRYACDASNRFALHLIRLRKPQIVVLAQRAEHELTDWAKVAAELRKMGVQSVILVGPVPEWKPFLYRTLALDYPARPEYSGKGLDESVFETDRILAQKFADTTNLRFISVVKLLCRNSTCKTTLDAVPQSPVSNPELTTFDYGHFTLGASDYVVRTLLKPVIPVF